MKTAERKKSSAFTLVEAVVVTVLISFVAAAILRASILALRSSRLNRHQLAAVNAMQEQVEAIRGMDYFRIGIRAADHVAFINYNVDTNGTDVYEPARDVLMSNAVVLGDVGTATNSDDLMATMVVTAWNVDDAFDGLGALDKDHKTNDYKMIVVTISWTDLGNPYTRSVTTMAYGIISDDIPYTASGATNTPATASSGDGDPPDVEISKAEYSEKDKKLTVQAVEPGATSVTLTVTGYGIMDYDSKKDNYKYDEKGKSNPGATVTVTSSDGSSATYPVTSKK